MNLPASPKGLEKVCGVPAGTVTQDPASTSTAVGSGGELQLALGHDEGLIMITVDVLRWGSRSGRHYSLDETQPMLGVRTVFDDAYSYRTTA